MKMESLEAKARQVLRERKAFPAPKVIILYSSLFSLNKKPIGSSLTIYLWNIIFLPIGDNAKLFDKTSFSIKPNTKIGNTNNSKMLYLDLCKMWL